MHNTSLRLLVLVAGCVLCAQAVAGVGTTTAGVTPTVGTSTDPSPNVEQQSSGFVQQNQQLQNAASPNGIALPAGVVAGTKPGQSTPADATATAANGDPAHAANANGHAAAATAAAATPPAPPPTYVSVIKHLNGSGDDAAPPPPEDKAPVPASVTAPPAAPKTLPPQKPARSARPLAQNPKRAAEPVVAPPASTGGRGDAPDGVTFYAGLAIAGLLLAFAFRLFLRTGKNDANRG